MVSVHGSGVWRIFRPRKVATECVKRGRQNRCLTLSNGDFRRLGAMTPWGCQGQGGGIIQNEEHVSQRDPSCKVT